MSNNLDKNLGPNFSMDISDTDTTLSFVQKFHSQAYPDNEVLVKNTSASEKGYEDRGLVSHTVESIMSGNALYRDPSIPLVAYNRLTSSSLDSQLAFAADYAANNGDKNVPDEQKFSFPNPTYTGKKDDQRFVTGQGAFESAVASSVLGTSYAPGYFQQKAESYKYLMKNNTEFDNGEDSSPDGEPYSIDPDATSLGSAVNGFPAAFVGDLNQEQKKVYEDLIFKLNSNGNIEVSGKAQIFYINANAKDKKTLSEYNDYGYSDGTTRKLKTVEKFLDLPDDNTSAFYPSLSLMLCLLELTSSNGIYLSGGFGTHRGSNLVQAFMTNMDQSTLSVTDHAFGRGFDIMLIGSTKDSRKSLESLISKPIEWKEQFEVFLSKLSSLPVYLQPDSIVFGRECFMQYLNPEDDPNRSKIKEILLNKFPGLGKHISFGTDKEGSTHSNHVHMSFGWSRAGNPNSMLQTGNSDAPATGIVTGTSPIAIDEKTKNEYLQIGTKNYEGDNQSSIEPKKMADLLVATGLYNIEEIATIVGIMKRESSIRPGAWNTAGAMGLMQIVFNDGTGWEDEKLPVPHGNSVNKKNGTITGYLLRNKNYTSDQASKGKQWNVTTVDNIFWYPINQISIMAYQMKVYYSQEKYKDAGQRKSSESKTLWSNWGDGPWGRGSNQMPYGVLSSVSRNTVQLVYEYLGGNWATDFFSWGAVALVDETAQIKRPINDAATQALAIKDEDGKIKSWKGAPYRNYFDYYLWFIGPEKILKGNSPRLHYPNSLSAVQAIISSSH
jgi:hypothetical protein